MKPGSLYWPTRWLTRPFRSQWFDLRFEGVENVPLSGPVILAPNHISFLDSALLMYELPRKVIFLGKAEYMQSRKTRFFRAAGMIPVDRGGKGLVTTLGLAVDVLRDGGVIGLFPEGTRSRDGRVHKGHTGAAYLAQRTNAALIPVGIRGTDLIQPPDARFPARGGTVVMTFGAPLDIAGYETGASGRAAMTDRLMDSIAVLAQRPYEPSTVGPGSAIPNQPADSV